MKGSVSVVRSFVASSSRSSRVSSRSIASSSCRRGETSTPDSTGTTGASDLAAVLTESASASATPTSSTASSPSQSAAATPPPAPRLPSADPFPGETKEEAFERNVREMQAFRRRKAALHVKTPFIPPSAAPPPTASPLHLTLSTLLASGAALGHSPSLLNAAFSPYVYGTRSGLSIIDLDKTLPLLRRAASLVRDVVKADGIILMVGTKPGLRKLLERGKERLGDNGYITRDWVPGLLTNAESVFGARPMIDGGFLPDLVIFLNPADTRSGLRECVTRNIPTVGIIDSDMDPRNVTYPIPANQESVRTAELILGTLTLAGQEGRRMRLKEAEARAARDKERRAREREDMRRRTPPRRGRSED